MDPALYLAASKGDCDKLQEYDHVQLDTQLTANGNTVLHVACQYGKLRVVKYILNKYVSVPALLHNLTTTNNRKETPLHLAASKGHTVIVDAIIKEVARIGGTHEVLKMIRSVNIDGDTALHVAVRLSSHNQQNMTAMLIVLVDPGFKYPRNNVGETPLYLVVERGESWMLSTILNLFELLDYGGPSGRTVMHAAASALHEECLRMLLQHKKDLVHVADSLGWTPLHYAVCFNSKDNVSMILCADKSVAYVKADTDGKRTALHIATEKGYTDIMKEILSHCPDSWEMVNGKGQNILHIAAARGKEDIIKFIFQQPWSKLLVNEKDDEGNTPVHLFYASIMSIENLEMHKYWSSSTYQRVANNKNLMPCDTACSGRGQDHDYPYLLGRNIIRDESDKALVWDTKLMDSDYKEMERRQNQNEHMKNMANTHLIVAALVATVTFASGFTIPGGYYDKDGPKPGGAILLREAAFKAFMVTNTIALVSSVSAVCLYFTASLYSEGYDNLYKRYKKAMFLVLIGLGAMVVAFMTGAYAVFNNDTALADSILGICGLSFVVYLKELKSMKLFAYMKYKLKKVSLFRNPSPMLAQCEDARKRMMHTSIGIRGIQDEDFAGH